MYSYIARQPILDGNKSLIGYELLFRNGEQNAFPDVSDEEATTRLIVEQQIDSDIHDLVGDRLAFINFSRISLLDQHPKILPSKEVVIEVLETVIPDEEVIAVCQDLKKCGYSLALDDHDFNQAWQPWVHLFDIIKIDISQFSRQELKTLLAANDFGSARLLAERVETEDDFVYFQQQGFSLFQGYFFAKPQMIRKRSVPANSLVTLQVLALINKKDYDFEALETLISSDPGLTFKLLHFLNSAYFNLDNKFSTLKQALVYLGQKEINKFFALVSMTSLGGSGQHPAVALAAIRAYFCANVALKIQDSSIQDSAFLMGLLSMIDTLLENSMENLLERLPVDKPIREALLDKTGIGAELLQLAEYFELADWENISRYSQHLALDEAELNDCYQEAVRTASKFMSAQ